LGSIWLFYPFPFVVSDKTIIDAPDDLTHLKGKRIKTVLNLFKKVYENTKELELDVFEYSLYL
jgi:hypothetical protein